MKLSKKTILNRRKKGVAAFFLLLVIGSQSHLFAQSCEPATRKYIFDRAAASYQGNDQYRIQEALRVASEAALNDVVPYIIKSYSVLNIQALDAKEKYLVALVPEMNDTAINRAYQLSQTQLELCLLKKRKGDLAITQNPNTNSQPQQTPTAPQQAQQQAQQAQDAARVAQTRADQARQGQRRRHEPENEASQCIQPDFGGLYGGMKNTCDFKVWYTYCGYRPKESSWLTGMSCEKQSFGSDSVSPGRTSASHTKGVESIHWIACKEPAWALDAEFIPGQGIKGRCHTVGGR